MHIETALNDNMPDRNGIRQRVPMLRKKAAERWNVEEKDCHIGHLALQGMLQEPDLINQIDGATDERETNLSVATRTMRLASAMENYGLKPRDSVIIMGKHHLDLCIPYFACHVGGYSMCAVDHLGSGDLTKLWPYVSPKMIFCQKINEEKVREAYNVHGGKCQIIVFDDKKYDLEAFIEKYRGTEANYRPAVFDQSKTAAWLILTSGTTGLPKVAIIPFDTLLNAVIAWWVPVAQKIEMSLTTTSLQWMSALLFFISGPIISYTRLQSSAPPSPQGLIYLINKYKPHATALSPYILGQFLVVAEKVCDLTCFRHIIIGGAAIEKPLLDKMRTQSDAHLNLVYGMTELLVPVFRYDEKTPYGASGRALSERYQHKLVDLEGKDLKGPNEIGELWIKGDDFFKGYKNNPEETNRIYTEDGWFRTGDMFYKDERGYYFFVERKRLLIKHYGFHISPLQMEEVLRTHPGVAEACVVNIPIPEYQELPVAAILKKNGTNVDFQELFDLLNNNIAEGRKLATGFFFIDAFPITPSGKLHRAKVKEMAPSVEWKIFKRNL